MARTIGRRPLFFFLAALVCVALVPATPPELRWVNWATAALGFVWAVLLAIEELTTQGSPRGRPPRREGGTPFAPTPPPGAARSER